MIIRFSRGIGMGARLVRWGQRLLGQKYWQYAHVDVVYGPIVFGAIPDRGVCFYVPTKSDSDLYIELPAVDEDKLWSFVDQHEGKKYDFAHVALHAFTGIDMMPEQEKFYCSELIADMLVELGLLTSYSDARNSPAKLLQRIYNEYDC